MSAEKFPHVYFCSSAVIMFISEIGPSKSTGDTVDINEKEKGVKSTKFFWLQGNTVVCVRV